ncbi:MAG: sulfatase [Akkermansiaceae bacterium]|jgi:arylsulfatase A-like enzyme|nr:sulfatase [Akkermansiaceae bacterium]MDP4896195.1 sulfatase [Akkermansiaceae bacterium]
MKHSLTSIIGLLALSCFAAADDGRPEKPNVVLILTDDLGWQDVKCYDIDEPSPMETPNLDALAKKGVMFWQAYSPAPTCAPSRCAILSGNHPARAQKTHVVGGAPPAPNSPNSRMMDPWYSGRMPADELTLAKLLGQNGYVTGHSGKWHIAIDHHAFPQPKDVGFDYTRSSRGSRRSMDDRLTGFATTDPKDPFRLDENGYPYDETNEDALTFMKENADKPFFLYYATWLVHSPIHTRSEERLKKYVEKIGTDPANVGTKETTTGQINPFYAAMVEELDYYLGVVFKYLEETEDPRWPGHKLSENTYLIFTSDNGGMEGSSERYTDNNPLDRGKISAKEGGTRVPLIVTGPGIPAGVQTDVLANGLDFYPTILSWTGVEKPTSKHLDGSDISKLLAKDPTDPALVIGEDGGARDTMMWHFPHGSALESTLRIGDYKLIRNYDEASNPPIELFRLYETKDGKQTRVDIEESKNLVSELPEKAKAMDAKLTEILEEMKASYPSFNPQYPNELPHKETVPTALSHEQKGDTVTFTYRENGAKVAHADLIYTLNYGERYEEWFRAPATVVSSTQISAKLPEGTTHFYLNLIDENHFLVSYPEVPTGRGKKQATDGPIAVKP